MLSLTIICIMVICVIILTLIYYKFRSEYFTTDSLTHIKGLEDIFSREGYTTVDRPSNYPDLPISTNEVTPYDIDIADPSYYLYQVQSPRVVKKDPLAIQADSFRGDIPIKMYPGVPMVEKSIHGKESLRLDGMFSNALNGLYEKYTNTDSTMYQSLGTTIIG